MPGTARRRSLTIAAALLALLAAPAAAQAATYTVKSGDGPCGGGDLACGSLADAAAAATPNDVFNVSPGNYGSATFDDGGLTITGTPNFTVDGALTFSAGAGGVTKLSKAAISSQSGAGPAVAVTGAAGLEISDSGIVSAGGDGVQFSEGQGNKIVRSFIYTGGQSTAAVRVTSADLSGNDKALVMESTLVTGGAAGVSVNTGQGNALLSAPGDVALTLRHVTAAGSANGLVLDASKANPAVGGPVGSITADVTDSIIQNPTSKANYAGLAITAPPNAVTDTYTRTLMGAFDPNAVFQKPASRNYRLRPGSPAIDKAGFTAGESTTDLDGEARPGPTTDQGADEFVNEAPKAVLEVKTNPQRTGRPVEFDASRSTDRETGAGGGIVKYTWNFGDGQTAETTTPTTTHVYTREGDGTASLIVTDAQGAVSAAATAPVKLVDGVPPAIVITKPSANQKIRLTTKKKTTKFVMVRGKRVKKVTTTTKRTKISFGGSAKDKNGVKGVVITIERLSVTPSTSTAARSSAATSTKRCTWIDPSKGAVLRSCLKPVLILAKLAGDGTWSYSLKRTLKLKPGLYRVIAAGRDNAGAAGNSAPIADAIHRFRLVK